MHVKQSFCVLDELKIGIQISDSITMGPAKIRLSLNFLRFQSAIYTASRYFDSFAAKGRRIKNTKNLELQDEVVRLETMVQSICDNYLLTVPTATEKKIMGQYKTPTSGQFAIIEKEKELRNERAKLLNQ